MAQPFSAQLSSTVVAVKANGAGQVFGWLAVNQAAAESFIQVFDVAQASTVTLGTTVPNYVIPVPASGAGGYAAITLDNDNAIPHTNGIQVAATTTRSGSSTAAVDLLMFFK